MYNPLSNASQIKFYQQITHSTAYRWRDKQGRGTVSDQPPTGDTPYEEIQYHNDANVISADKLTGKTGN